MSTSDSSSDDRPFSESGIVVAGLASAIAFHCGVVLDLCGFDEDGMLLALMAFMVGSAVNSMMGQSKKLRGRMKKLPAAAVMIATIVSAGLLLLACFVLPGVSNEARIAVTALAFLLLGFFVESDMVVLIGCEQNLKSSLKRGTIEKAFMAAALLALAVSLFSVEFRLPAMAVLAIVASVLAFFVRSGRSAPSETMAPALTASKDYYLNRRMAALAIIISAALAFSFVLAAGQAFDAQRCAAALALGLIAAALLVFARFRHIPQFSETVSIALVSAVLCLVLLRVDATASLGIVYVVAFAIFQMLLLMTMIGTLNTIGKFHLDFVSYFLTSRRRYLLGFLAGAVTGIIAARIPSVQMPLSSAFGLAIAVAVALVLAPLGTRTAHGVLRQGFEETKYVDDYAREGSFDQSCESIGERFGLTRRETDVFAMLAQGFDTQTIADKLVVTESTVKSHSAHIYRKCNVHSKQQIIAMVAEDLTGKMPRQS